VAGAVKQYVAAKAGTLPDGVELDYWADTTYYLNQRLDMMLRNLALGAVLVCITLAMFLELSMAFWVMLGLPVCFLGALALLPALASRSTLLLPDTHSKWLRLEAGRIVDFQTYMTGELYALLAEHSILGRPARAAHRLGEIAAPEAFDRGVAAVRAQGAGGASELLFTTRALVLASRLNAADSLEYLSGLLIGEELRCALGAVDVRSAPLALIGDAALCQRYRRALALWQGLDVPAVEAAAPVGLWRIATQAGLTTAQ